MNKLSRTREDARTLTCRVGSNKLAFRYVGTTDERAQLAPTIAGFKRHFQKIVWTINEIGSDVGVVRIVNSRVASFIADRTSSVIAIGQLLNSVIRRAKMISN
ncbi:hypothetical protein D2V07_17130 [Aurantiacibacter zhengii]|uniref:Uncharacterized protein n=1 Tax=Aurantiacibacter zhengii TaxID=2307003 RepID=A0A418NNB8_9SPHN|nr:hypothetical protein D2V07_17130 [Aurantiacibacter zhengii]